MQAMSAGSILCILLLIVGAYTDIRRRMIPRMLILLVFVMGVIPSFALGWTYFIQLERLAGLLIPAAVGIYLFLLRNESDGLPAGGEGQDGEGWDDNDQQDGLHDGGPAGEGGQGKNGGNTRRRSEELAKYLPSVSADQMKLLTACGFCFGFTGLCVIVGASAIAYAIWWRATKRNGFPFAAAMLCGVLIYYGVTYGLAAIPQ